MGRGWPGALGHRISAALRWRLRAVRARRAAARRDPHAVALEMVRQVERRERPLPTRLVRRVFTAHGRALTAASAPESIASLIPEMLSEPAGRQHVRAAVAADAVVLAKFGVRGGIKLRAAYAGADLTVAVDGSGDLARLERILHSHRVVGAVDPTLIPPLVSSGSLPGGACYVVERWVHGRSVTTGSRLTEAAPEVLRRLRAVHLGHGVEQLPLGAWWDEMRQEWWEETVRAELVPPHVVDAVGALVGHDDRTVATSWCHGDLVASNVIDTDAGHVLIDWERAGVAPVMLDAARLHLFSGDPERTLADIRRQWSWETGPTEVDLTHQLALAHAYQLSAYPLRRAGLATHARAAVYERQARRQVARLAQVLDLPV